MTTYTTPRIVRLARTHVPRNPTELRAFLLGVREFRRSFTSNPGDDLLDVYDFGREVAHLVTFRRFDS